MYLLYPRMQYSGFYDALKNIADQFGADIPTVRGDGGPYWEDGIAADAYYAAIERENESRAPSAEKLATLTSLVNPNLAADKGDLERIWTHMVLFDEHTWTASNSITRSHQPGSRPSACSKGLPRGRCGSVGCIAGAQQHGEHCGFDLRRQRQPHRL